MLEGIPSQVPRFMGLLFNKFQVHTFGDRSFKRRTRLDVMIPGQLQGRHARLSSSGSFTEEHRAFLSTDGYRAAIWSDAGGMRSPASWCSGESVCSSCVLVSPASTCSAPAGQPNRVSARPPFRHRKRLYRTPSDRRLRRM